MTNKEVKQALKAVATPERATTSAWFFKTAPGQYGHGDKFLGVTVPQQRKIAKQFKDLPLKEVEKLVTSPWHEERLTGLFILVGQFQRGDQPTKQEIYHFYLNHTASVNNWDLVDSSAGYIAGAWLNDRPEKMKVLTKLADSKSLWERRIAMISTQYFIGQGRGEEAWAIAELLLHDSHDLIQKAVGWMLREMGKRADHQLLIMFLDKHAATMPRTTLRYAIEHLSKERKQHYMGLKTKQ